MIKLLNPNASQGAIEDVKLKDTTGTTVNPSTEDTTQDLYNLLSYLLDRLEYGLITDASKRLKITVESFLATIPAVTTVTTVSSVTNQARIGDVQAQRVVEAQLDTAFTLGITNHLAFPIGVQP